MEVYLLETGNFRLDGGAVFGVVPKAIWSKFLPSDTHNRVPLSMRSILLVKDNQLILIDTGIGNKQSEKFFSHYQLFGETTLTSSLHRLGFSEEQITDVFLTHLHFDHCGGAVKRCVNQGFLEPTFKNARYWTNLAHWDWAIQPNPREKASFLKENLLPIFDSGQLCFIPTPKEGNMFFCQELGFEILFVDGHTEKQMIPMIDYFGKKIIFSADLLPTTLHIPLPYIPSYDIRPLNTIKEKQNFYEKVLSESAYIVFQHDFNCEACTLVRQGDKVQIAETFKFSDLFI